MAVLFSAFAESRACIWDSDTLAMEQARFPGMLDVMGGNFPRHSPEFYAWRIERVRVLLVKDPRNATLRDDLSVALHKLGRHAEAIQVMLDSLAITPNRYETLSNLGTFTIYTGDLPASRVWLQKALAINPNAHFGREKYQLWLVEYLMLRADPASVPEITDRLPPYSFAKVRENYAEFVMFQQGKASGWLEEDARGAALRGVLGMMLFADYQNPVLLEALGDILEQGDPRKNAVHMAEQAYALARDLYGEKTAAERLDRKTKEADSSYSSKSAPDLKKLKKAMSEAQTAGKALAKRVREDELKWIASGQDAGREFEKKYLGASTPTVEFRAGK
ncbi:hypothetical protein [Rariglobus hedericola]|uniref:Uncharacterized protein n=2 Tax=Rariglobus hedericola TaxID=2597822 RepID=A0A556QJ54_9BACT|nr:hypothetical protein FPL22_11200 [Rariglobus hedericola]